MQTLSYIATIVGTLLSLLLLLRPLAQRILRSVFGGEAAIGGSIGHKPLPQELGLRIAHVDVEQALAAFGRVPLERPPQTSLYRTVRRFLQHVACRPSSPKPAFAVRSCRRESDGRGTGAEASHVGGFHLTIELGCGEHPEHFRRSLSSTVDSTKRVLAVCSPDQLPHPDSRVRCYLVNAERDRICLTESDDALRLRLASADPLGASHGHDWWSRLAEVPRNALWLVRAGESQPTAGSAEALSDWRSAWTQRYRPMLLIWALVAAMVALGTLSAALLFAIVWLVADALRIGAGFSYVNWLEILGELARGYLAASTPFVGLGLLWFARHGCARWREYRWRKGSWGEQWAAGTTGCIQDANDMRNGLADSERLHVPRSGRRASGTLKN